MSNKSKSGSLPAGWTPLVVSTFSGEQLTKMLGKKVTHVQTGIKGHISGVCIRPTNIEVEIISINAQKTIQRDWVDITTIK